MSDPGVLYQLTAPIFIPAGQNTRVDYNEELADSRSLVARNAPGWRFQPPVDGVYLVTASVSVSPSPGADIVLTAKTAQKVVFSSLYVATSHETADGSQLVRLAKGEDLWFEVGHSAGDNPQHRIVGGWAGVSFQFLS